MSIRIKLHGVIDGHSDVSIDVFTTFSVRYQDLEPRTREAE